MLQVLVTISPTISMQKRSMGYARVIHKKEKEKKKEELKKWTSVQSIKIMGTQMPA